MSIKTLLFILFLYTSLVWVAAFRLHPGPELVSFALLWTGGGLAAVLALVVISWLFGAWKRFRSRPRPRKAPAAKPVERIHPEDAAISALIAQANAEMAKLSRAPQQDADFRRLPLYLLAGPEGCGKTSTFANCGAHSRLLAGRVSDERSPEPTDLMNIWLVYDVAFVDISGRVFNGPPDTWLRILRALRVQTRRPLWKRIWMGPDAATELRGVVAFVDAKELISASPDPQRLDRSCRHWRERLRAVTDVFGTPVLVWQIFSKADTVPFFADYFARLRDADRAQVFGCALPPVESQGGESPARRLTACFRDLYKSVAARRIAAIASEPRMAVRAGIYEFPRELKKIRSALVQFLSEAFRSDGTDTCPALRAFYFTGAIETAAPARNMNPASPDDTAADFEASRFFATDATRMFRPNDLDASFVQPQHGKQRLWLFTSELFGRVIPADRPALKRLTVSDRGEARLQRIAVAAFASVCVIGWAGWSLSWAMNRSLLGGLQTAAIQSSIAGQGAPTLTALRSLERMRTQLVKLGDGPGVTYHLGLYSGSRLLDPLRAAYFRRFQGLLLDSANASLVSRLASPPAAGSNTSPDSLYRILKTHLMITSGVCRPEPRLVSGVLKDAVAAPAAVGNGDEWNRLAARQIDFYAGELERGNPCRLAENTAATARARDFLRNAGGANGLYSSIVANAERTLNKPLKLTDLAPNYSKVLSGPNEMSQIFSRQGWNVMEKASKEQNAAGADSCAIGARTVADTDASEIQRLYLNDYADHWRKYLSSYSVLRYGGAQDAAAKLAVLSDHNSPLLALFAMVARETDFKTASAPGSVIEQLPVVGKLAKSANIAALSAAPPKAVSPAILANAFQPVHRVVEPGSDTWITEKNAAWAEALAQLGHSMQDLASDTTPDPAAIQTANQSYEKALDAARQIARGFKPEEVDGIDAVAERLLEEPILRAKAYIPGNPDAVLTSRANGQARAFCQTATPLLHKFPFQNSAQEISLTEFSYLFAPGTGAVWKFQTEALADLVVKDGGSWRAKDPSKKPAPRAELLNFLNRAESIADAFYPGGATSPHFRYVLRPRPDSRMPKDVVIELDVDGQRHDLSVLQQQFTWPAAPGAKAGAVGRLRIGGVSVGFGSADGLWGIFRLIAWAEPRPAASKIIEWKYTRGMSGPGVEIQPAPVRLEIVEASGGPEVLNPGYFSGLQCPAEAVR